MEQDRRMNSPDAEQSFYALVRELYETERALKDIMGATSQFLSFALSIASENLASIQGLLIKVNSLSKEILELSQK